MHSFGQIIRCPTWDASLFVCLGHNANPFRLLFSSACYTLPMAGTESNNELCTHIPGPACEMDSGNLQAGPGEGFIHIQRGVHGIADLAASEYDWRNPVAEVFIAAQ